ncbi:MAG: Serine/threonine-protein kinase PknD [Planctomycetes bacterium]|nr:Serine/threonine-protein kinase PknD [Planctomycetota bacterium]
MPRLLIEKGPDRGKSLTLKLGDQAVVGRDAQANLQLSDVMCSRKHFLIASKGSVYGLKDLGSANGTQVNGKTADGPVKLAHGDMIQCGETLLSWLADESDARQGGLIGQQIGGYRIEMRLGRGAMGTVYKAIQLSLGRIVALKVLSPDLVKDAKFCEMFLKEARAAGGLNHPNIIQVYDVGEEKGQYYFSMEFAAKGSVLDLLNSAKRIELLRAVVIIKDACRALDYAERKGLVHRDIKPDNLMVMDDEIVKLGDLGLAMSAQELQGEQAGVFGTPHYIAPEQAMGKPIDHRADIYALGASFYRILTGQTLFTGQTVKEILKKQVRDPHPPVTTHLPDCPPAIVTIIDKMLAKNPAERYQHASDVLNDLENWQSLASKKGGVQPAAFAKAVKAPGAELQEQMVASAQRRNLALAAIAAVVGVAALSIMVWVFFFSDSPTPNTNVAEANNTPANLPPANSGNGGGTTAQLTPEQESANRKLQQAIGAAQLSSNKGDHAAAIAILEKALKDNALATESAQAEARKYLEQVKLKAEQEGQSEQAMREEWSETQRHKAAKIEEYKYKAADDILRGFIEKHAEVQHPGKKKIWDDADAYWRAQFWEDVKRHIAALRQWVVKQSEQAILEQDLEKRLAIFEAAQSKAQGAFDACDHEDSRKELKKILDSVTTNLDIVKRSISDEKRRVIEQALAECEQAVTDLCTSVGNDIQRGDFRSAMSRVDNYEKSDKNWNQYKADPRFAGVGEVLRRRREQTRHELEALRALGAGGRGALTSAPKQAELLKQKPWPKAAADLFGSKDARFRMDVQDAAGDRQFTLTVFVGSNKSEWSAGDFAPSGSRSAAGLAAAITHLALNDDTLRAALLQPGSVKGDPPLVAGLWAWLAELGHTYEIFALMDSCYAQAPVADPGRAVFREYMAYALKVQARDELNRGNTARSEDLIQRLNSDEFAGTRARTAK